MKFKFKNLLATSCLVLSSLSATAQESVLPFRNPDLPLEQRINDLIGRLTLDEKVQMMKHASPAIPRLGIPAYNWWNEALHGVARAGTATVFPSRITWTFGAFSIFSLSASFSTVSGSLEF